MLTGTFQQKLFKWWCASAKKHKIQTIRRLEGLMLSIKSKKKKNSWRALGNICFCINFLWCTDESIVKRYTIYCMVQHKASSRSVQSQCTVVSNPQFSILLLPFNFSNIKYLQFYLKHLIVLNSKSLSLQKL